MKNSLEMMHWTWKSTSLFLLAWLTCGCDGGREEAPSFDSQYKAALGTRNAESRAKRLILIARDQNEAGDTAGAKLSLGSARDASQEVADPFLRARLYNSLAYAQGQMSMIREARQSLSEVRRLAHEIADPENQVDVLARAALAYDRYINSDRDVASCLNQAATLAESIEDPARRIQSLVLLSRADQILGDVARTRSRLEEAVELARSLEEARPKSDSLALIAGAFAKLQDTGASSSLFNEALTTAEAIEETVNRSHALAEIAMRLTAADEKSKAIDVLDQAERDADSIRDRGLRKEILEKIGKGRASIR